MADQNPTKLQKATKYFDKKLEEHYVHNFMLAMASPMLLILTFIAPDSADPFIKTTSVLFSVICLLAYIRGQLIVLQKTIAHIQAEFHTSSNGDEMSTDRSSKTVKDLLQSEIAQISQIREKIQNIAFSESEQRNHLSVVAPAGPWLQTTAWEEIIKKMREMLRVHGWGQIPTLSNLNYRIQICDNVANDGSEIRAQQEDQKKIESVSDLARLDYIQWHGLKFDSDLRTIDKKGKTVDGYNGDIDLRTVIKSLAPIYIVLPFESYARNKSVLKNFVPVYPITDRLEEKLKEAVKAKYGETEDCKVLAYLRQVQWMTQTNQKFLDKFEKEGAFGAIAGDHEIVDSNLDYDPNESQLGPASFSIKILYPLNGTVGVHRIRYISLFDRSGKPRCKVRKIIDDCISGDPEGETILADKRRVSGGYVPLPEDLDGLKGICDKVTTREAAENVKVLYNWAYVHVRSVRLPCGTPIYKNDSWSFQASNVAFFEKAQFRAAGSIEFKEEYSVIPYTMDEPRKAPEIIAEGKEIKFTGRDENDRQLVTCPTDAFHISWYCNEDATAGVLDTQGDPPTEERQVGGSATKKPESDDETVVHLPATQRASA